MKKLLALLLAAAMVLALVPMTAMAASPVARVGSIEYDNINDAVAAWTATNNSTLTLLADVTLSDVIKLSSTEYHILDLGTYTMTAALKKDAIQIVNNGRSSASYALDIKADATNPGGITATGKAIVRTAGKSDVKDRPIIRFYNGVFNASNIVSHSGSNGTNCPQFQFHGGDYTGTISTNRTLNQFYGGTFHGSLIMSVDSSAYTLIAGGTFKQLSNLQMSALNSSKFTIGSAKGVYDREVYVNDDGYYVVATAKPATIEASVKKTPGPNDYLKYSKVDTEGKLNYTDAATALNKNTSATVTVYVDEIDLTGSSFKGTILLPKEDSKLTITYAEGTTPNWKVETDLDGKVVSYEETVENGVVKRVYTVKDAVTVRFIVEGSVLKTETIARGDDVALPAIPEKDGYTAAWNHDGKNIIADTTDITATYTLILTPSPTPTPTPEPTPIPEEAPIPETGDGMGLFVFASLVLISLLGMAMLKKREA